MVFVSLLDSYKILLSVVRVDEELEEHIDDIEHFVDVEHTEEMEELVDERIEDLKACFEERLSLLKIS